MASGRAFQGLTAKQERFAQLVAKGETYSDAYRQSYDAGGMKDNTIYSHASELMADERVAARVEYLMKEVERAMVQDAVAIRQHVLTRLHAESINDSSPAAARIRALELLGKTDIVGMFRERVEVPDIRRPEDIEAELRKRLARLQSLKAIEAGQ